MASCHRAMVERTKGRRPKNRPCDTKGRRPKNRPAKGGTLEATWVRGKGTREPWRRGATDFLQVVAATPCATLNSQLGRWTSPLGYGGFTVQSSTACSVTSSQLHALSSPGYLTESSDYFRHRVRRGISFPACGPASLLFRPSFGWTVKGVSWESSYFYSFVIAEPIFFGFVRPDFKQRPSLFNQLARPPSSLLSPQRWLHPGGRRRSLHWTPYYGRPFFGTQGCTGY